MNQMQPIVELDNVSLRYQTRLDGDRTLKGFIIHALSKKTNLIHSETMLHIRNISLTINHGERIGVIGRNGSGKSTLLKIVAGVIRPDSGRVLVDGKVTPLMDIGTGMNGDLTCLENIILAGAYLGIEPTTMKRRSAEILEWCDLRGYENHYFHTLSTGMQSRLAFAVATAITLDIVLVDEILSVGDLDFQAKSSERMSRLQNAGTTTLIVSHDLNYLKAMTTRVLWLEAGAVKMDGNPNEVISAYRKSFLP